MTYEASSATLADRLVESLFANEGIA
jgi:hypothetical protein